MSDLLTPMRPHGDFSIPQHQRVIVEFTDANHFTRAVNFAETNHLTDQLARRFLDLTRLLMTTRGALIPRQSWMPEGYPQQYEPGKATIYPDGYHDPGFGWSGAGMVGGLIFHRHSREWSIHT